MSIMVSLGSTAIATVVGTGLGVVAAYWGNGIETLIMRGTDVLLSFPPIVLAMVAVAFLGSSVSNVIVVIGTLFAPRCARVAHGSALGLKENLYVEAARAIGCGHGRIILRTMLPNMLAPVFVQVSLSLGYAILLESGLSYLGLGPPAPAITWGRMISDAKAFMHLSPWYVVWPSLVVCMVVLAFNILGDGLRDQLDPRLRAAGA